MKKYTKPKDGAITWFSTTKYVDTETGEQIRKKTALSREYIKTKTNKITKLNKNKTHGYIEYTIECRRNPQREFAFDNT